MSFGRTHLVLLCPGCGNAHGFDERWTVTSRDPLHVVPSHLQHVGEGQTCHLNILEGKIHFASDSTHGMSGQVVDVKPEWVHFSSDAV